MAHLRFSRATPALLSVLLGAAACGSAGTSDDGAPPSEGNNAGSAGMQAAGAGGGGAAGAMSQAGRGSGGSHAGGMGGTAGNGGSANGGASGGAGAAGAEGGTAGASSGGGGQASGGGGSAGSSGANAGQGGSAGAGGSAADDTLSSNRQRLLQSYFEFLQSSVTTPQTNGLSGSNVASPCDVWSKLDPSSQAVFLTLTARMQGSILGIDGSSMLSHVVKVYRITGGQGATATDAGSCGGGEYNRMIMSMDAELHDAQAAANAHQGGLQPNGKYDIADAPMGTFWRDSHDLGGPHAPFDESDETDKGAPRGQTQYFADPTSTAATSPLGRQDLETLVDPYALEMDQDYDCVHNSNPSCTYTTYGPACFPEASALGTDVYQKTYGSFDPGWMPVCP